MKLLHFTVRFTVAHDVTADEVRDQLDEALDQYFIDDGRVTETLILTPEEAIDQ